MIVYAADARQAPAGRYVTGMEEQRTFNRAFPTVVQRNLADCDCIPPMLAARGDRRHICAAHEGELAFLEYDTT